MQYMRTALLLLLSNASVLAVRQHYGSHSQHPGNKYVNAGLWRQTHWECESACAGADSTCITSCETAMYNCILKYQDVAKMRPSTFKDKEAEEKAKKCQAKVLQEAKRQRGPTVGDQRNQ
mmetsp:Transcript_112850/g.224551  ORF Transcript_112850/g.224551 Transcript_112850/m.224551 type:complete len:120 (+) Transcript_112850:100-459(+)